MAAVGCATGTPGGGKRGATIPCASVSSAPGPLARDRLLLAAVVLLTFWPALGGAYLADDIRLLQLDPALADGDLWAFLTRPLFGVEHGYWRPLTQALLWLGTRFDGPFGVHLLALLLHLANAFLVRALARQVVTASAATWVAVVFAVHPVQVESVAWCSAINDPAWVAGCLTAMLAARRYGQGGGVGWLLAVAGAVTASIAAKEVGVVAVPLAVASARWLRPPAGVHRGGAAVAAAAAAGALAWFGLRAVVQQEPFGAVITGAGVAVVEPLAIAGRAASQLVAQLALLVQPFPLTPMRTSSPTTSTHDVACTLVVVVALLWLAGRRRAPATRLAVAMAVVPLLPPLVYRQAIGIYPVADRYVYLSVVGGALLLADRAWLWRRAWVPWLLPAVLAPLAFAATWNWRSLESFTAHVVAAAPDDAMALVMAGDLELDKAHRGEPWALAAAESFYRRGVVALAAQPPGTQRQRTLGRARLGEAWCRLLRSGPGDPGDAVVSAFQAATEAAPDNADAWVGLGVALASRARADEARAAFTAALRLDPRRPGALRGLAELAKSHGGH